MGRTSRKTKQKEIIMSEMKKFESFFTAEDLYSKLKKKDKTIGIATVYRFLREFSAKDKLHSFICGKKNIYSTNDSNHCHFICEKCKNTSHIKVKNIDFIKNKIRGIICHIQVDVYGICENCKDNSN